jgi:GH43 family beta-xylosidase
MWFPRSPRPQLLATALVVVALAVVLPACGDDTPDELGEETATTVTGDGEKGNGSDNGDGAEGEDDDESARPPTDGTDTPGVEEGAGARVVSRLGPDGGVPLSDGDFADPFVLDTSVIPIGYTSNTREANVPVSRGGPRGEVQLGDALPEVGSWSEEGFVWAPSVLQVAEDRFVLYYTSRHAASGRQCIGVAVADDPVGPFVDDSDGPFICQLGQGGSIDASPYAVGETPYLVWKSDGNCCAQPTHIYAQQLGADGTSLVGQPAQLITNDLPWEGDVVEGPSMVDVDGTLHLFWSANAWDSADYAIGHAVCESPLGPCVKDPEPFVVSGEEYQGPGGQEFFTDRAGRRWMAFHAWLPGEVGYANGGSRRLFLEEITFDENGRPQLVADA